MSNTRVRRKHGRRPPARPAPEPGSALSEGAVAFRAWIAAKKIRHADLADQLDCAKSYIAMLSTGAAAPGLGLAARIETVCAIPCSAWTRPALAA